MKTKRLHFFLHLILFFLFGLWYSNHVWSKSISMIEENAIEFGLTAKANISLDMVKELEASNADLIKQEYIQIKSDLMNIVKFNSSIRFAYLYTLMDGDICFLVDSEPSNSEEYSPPGQIYGEATEEDFKAIEQSDIIITKPTKDRWGTWVSVLVPMKDPITDDIIAVFGMDYPAETYSAYAKQRSINVAINILFLSILYILIHIIVNQNRILRKEKQKLSETNQLLSEKENLFRTLFEQSPYGISFGNNKTNIIDTNEMFEQIIGRSKEELSSLNWTDITHPEDIATDMEYFKRFTDGEIQGYSLVKRYMRSDGSFVWVNMRITRLFLSKEEDEEIRHICTLEDITEKIQTQANLEETERNIAMLLSNLPGLAYRCRNDRNWTMEFVSEGSYELTGYTSEHLVQNKVISFNSIIHTDYQDLLWTKWNNVLKEKTIFKDEYAIVTANNQIKWVYEQGQGVYNEQGEIVAIEGLIIDISNQKKREDEIRYLTYHDVLSGLYNRRYYEEAKNRIDVVENYPISVIIGDINGLKFINSAIGHSEGDSLIIQAAKLLTNCCRPRDVLARTGGDEFSILMPNTTYEEADRIVRLIGKLLEQPNDLENSYHLSISLGCATKYEETTNLANIIKEAEESMYRSKLLQNKSLHSSIISTMKSTLYEKSQETEEHAQRLIDLSKEIGISLKLSEKQLNELELLSTLHDIGKIGIPDSILNKPGALTENEWVEMKKHPEMGYRIAMATPELAPIADYILNHHERWDGKGYPYGRKEEEIPLLSRIIAIADSYDAMTSDRSYRKALSKEAALAEIRNNAGSQFDPNIAELFIQLNNKTNEK